MPNQKGGKKFKKGKKMAAPQNKGLVLKDPKGNEDYGRVESAKGNGRFDIIQSNGNKLMGVIRGKDRKRMWINKDDIVLIGIWECQTNDDKCSILYKYEEHDISKLIEKKEIDHTLLRKDVEYGDTEHYTEDDIFDTSLPDSEEEEDKSSNSSTSGDESVIDVDDI